MNKIPKWTPKSSLCMVRRHNNTLMQASVEVSNTSQISKQGLQSVRKGGNYDGSLSIDKVGAKITRS